MVHRGRRLSVRRRDRRSAARCPRRPRGGERAAPRHRGLGAEPLGSWREHDAIVIATHADQALDLLADASREEKDVLGAFRYSRSETVLDTDARLLPTARRARASWNYLTPAAPDGDHAPVVTYWMNRLQGLDSAEQYLVTLNARDRIDPPR